MADYLDFGSKTIGVFASQFQGEFEGELVNQIRQHCLLRGYGFAGYCTGRETKYNCLLGLDHIDCAIIIRDCVTHDFAKSLLERNIATVSIGYDYFPVDIPIVSSDNSFGTELAFKFLSDLGHKTICFAGDLRNFDVRKRFEKFCELYEYHNMSFDEDLLIPVSNNDIGGGFEAGQEFISRGCHTTGVFCASGLVTIGFVSRLKKDNIELSENLEVIGYGAMPIVPVLANGVSLIDQNIHLIAYKAISALNDLYEDMPVAREQKVEPKLVSRFQEVETDNNLVLATSVDLPEIFNSGYMSSVLNNNFLWMDQISESGLEKLMGISPLFDKFMSLATFSKLSPSINGERDITILKKLTLEKSEKLGSSDQKNICKAAQFPPEEFCQNNLKDFDNMTHFPVQANGRVTGIITIFGKSAANPNLSSYLYLCGQLAGVAKFMGINLEKKLIKNLLSNSTPTEEKASKETSSTKHKIDWVIESNETTWSPGALSVLGLVSPIDVNIYKHMDITDRIILSDIDTLRSKISDSIAQQKPFITACKIKSKDGTYSSVDISGEPEKIENDIVTSYTFYIHAISDD